MKFLACFKKNILVIFISTFQLSATFLSFVVAISSDIRFDQSPQASFERQDSAPPNLSQPHPLNAQRHSSIFTPILLYNHVTAKIQ
jgi:hypothetical protein